MPHAIHAIHWDELDTPPGDARRLLAIWPAPVDHDACMARAGFHDFADSNEPWDAELADMARRLLDTLASLGTATLRPPPAPARSLAGRLRQWLTRPPPPPTPLEHLLAAAHSDMCPACVIDIGHPPLASVRTSDGHAIVWIRLAPALDLTDRLISAAAQDRPILRTSLDWTQLVSHDW